MVKESKRCGQGEQYSFKVCNEEIRLPRKAVGLELQAKIRYHTAHAIPTLNEQVPKTVVTVNTANISELVESGWYQCMYYRDVTNSYPLPHEELGRYLGPS